MLVRYDENGLIVSVRTDPVDKEALANLLNVPNCIHLMPEPWPEQVMRDSQGNIVLDSEGKPVMTVPGYTEPVVTLFTHRVVDGEIVLRPEIMPPTKTEIIADGKDRASFVRLPDPVTVYVDDEPHVVTGGRLDFTTSDSGTYNVEFKWPCQDYVVRIVAK